MLRFARVMLLAGLCAACLWVGFPVSSQTATGFRGRVQSVESEPLEGVAVSAKAQGSTMTTSVWTNQQGEYAFPALPDGRYEIWAQAVGFTLTRAQQTLAPGRTVSQDFTLPPYEELWRQMDDIEWLQSLPEGTPEDHGIPGRMKRVLIYQCSTCHNSAFILEKRFGEADWEMLFDYMTMDSHRADPPYRSVDVPARAAEYEDNRPGGGKFETELFDDEGRLIGAQRRGFAFYKDDIVSYLARVRGPEPYPIQWQPLPRPTGDAANIVVTEYDVPNGGTLRRLDPEIGRFVTFTLNQDGSTTRDDTPTIYVNPYRSGSDWSLGARSQWQELRQHDIKVGRDGYVYLPPGIGRGLDPDGNVWFTVGRAAVKFDVTSEQFSRYPLPEGWAGFHNRKDVDSQGNLWAATQVGAYRLSPETGDWSVFPSVTPLGRQYGLTVDREDRAWFAQIAVDKVGYVNGRTGDIGEVALGPIDDEPMLPGDRALNRGWTFNQPIYGKGPRRLQADPNGDYLWVCSFFGGWLGRIHIQTKEVKEFKLPDPYRLGNIYEPAVGKDGMVYFSMSNADFVGRFDPRSEEFTFFPIPTRGHNARNIDVDNTTESPEVWIPYSAAGKVARMQFRTNPGR